MIPTPQIRDLRDAAESVQQYWICALNMEISDEELKKAIDEYQAKADPTTVKALCTELIARRSHDPQPRERTA